jgi:hypothetical protein
MEVIIMLISPVEFGQVARIVGIVFFAAVVLMAWKRATD